jgi:type I restriction-modification system DNA methylase subunit
MDFTLYSLQESESDYLELVDTYVDEDGWCPEAPALYSEAFGALHYGVSETEADLLGIVYEELSMESDAFGQHFTPHSCAETKVESLIQVDEIDGGPYKIADPTCGSGRLLIEAAKQLPEGVEGIFYGQDSDGTCARMTALNFWLFDMEGYAVHGDSLQLEVHRAWYIRPTSKGTYVREARETEALIKYFSRGVDYIASASADRSGFHGLGS